MPTRCTLNWRIVGFKRVLGDAMVGCLHDVSRFSYVIPQLINRVTRPRQASTYYLFGIHTSLIVSSGKSSHCLNLNPRGTLFVCAETNPSRKKRRRKPRSNSYGHDARSTRGAFARNSRRGADKAAGRRQECVWYGARSGSEHSRYVHCGVPSRIGQWPSHWK